MELIELYSDVVKGDVLLPFHWRQYVPQPRRCVQGYDEESESSHNNEYTKDETLHVPIE